MKTAIQQQMKAKRQALALSLLAKNLLSSIQTVAMNTLNRITESGSNGVRAIETGFALELCPQFANQSIQQSNGQNGFSDSYWKAANIIRGGSP